jgi:hypothetical protein
MSSTSSSSSRSNRKRASSSSRKAKEPTAKKARKQVISASAAQYYYNTRYAAARKQEAKEEALIFKLLGQDMIEYICSFLDPYPDRTTLSEVNRAFRSYHYGNDKPLVVGLTQNRLYSASTWKRGLVSYHKMKLALIKSLTPTWANETDNTKTSFEISQLYNHKTANLFVLPYIGKLYINLCGQLPGDRLRSIVAHTGILYAFHFWLTNLFFIDIDLSMRELDYIESRDSLAITRYELYKSIWSDIRKEVVGLFRSFELFSPTLKMVSLTTAGRYSILPILSSLSKLPSNIKYLHNIPHVNDVCCIRENEVDFVFNIDHLLSKEQEWIENPHIAALVQTAPSWNEKHPRDWDLGDEERVAWDRKKEANLQIQLFIVLRQLPNLKALHVSTAFDIYNHNKPELLQFPCFQSLEKISVNGHVVLKDFAWMPRLQHLRCGATIETEEHESAHLEFPSLTRLQIVTLQMSQDDSVKWSQYLKRYLSDVRKDRLRVYIAAFEHPDITCRNQDKTINISHTTFMNWTLYSSCGSDTEVLLKSDTREQVAVMNVDYACDFFLPIEEEDDIDPFIQFEFVQKQVGASMPCPEKGANLPECLLYVPIVARPEEARSPFISDVESLPDIEAEPIEIDWTEEEQEQEQEGPAPRRARELLGALHRLRNTIEDQRARLQIQQALESWPG